MRPFYRVLFILASVGSCMVHCDLASSVFAQGGFAQEDAEASSEEDLGAIKAAIGSYVEAFNARDARKLAAHWAPEGVYISRANGSSRSSDDRISGRDAIAKEFEAIFGSKNVPQLAVETESIEFISPNVAIERGIATIHYAEEGQYAKDQYAEGQYAKDQYAEGEDTEGSTSRSTYRGICPLLLKHVNLKL